MGQVPGAMPQENHHEAGGDGLDDAQGSEKNGAPLGKAVNFLEQGFLLFERVVLCAVDTERRIEERGEREALEKDPVRERNENDPGRGVHSPDPEHFFPGGTKENVGTDERQDENEKEAHRSEGLRKVSLRRGGRVHGLYPSTSTDKGRPNVQQRSIQIQVECASERDGSFQLSRGRRRKPFERLLNALGECVGKRVIGFICCRFGQFPAFELRVHGELSDRGWIYAGL